MNAPAAFRHNKTAQDSGCDSQQGSLYRESAGILKPLLQSPEVSRTLHNKLSARVR
jgi:hypothetical protein